MGSFEGVDVAAVSTGIGGPSTAIAVEELARAGVTTMVRVGSAGGLDPDLGPGDLVIPSGVVREDGTSATYVDPRYPAVPHPDVFRALVEAAARLGLRVRTGITRSHDSFYTDHEETVTAAWHRLGVLASDMETATLFVVGGLRGRKCGSVLNVVVPYGGALDEGIRSLGDAEQRAYRGEADEIRLALHALVCLA